MELSKKTTILFTTELHQFLLNLARRRGTSLGELVRTACELQYGFTDPENRMSAVDALALLNLPVDSPKTMKQQSTPSPEELLK